MEAAGVVLERAAAENLRQAGGLVVLAVVTGVIGVVAFDWPPADTLLDAVLGTAGFGALWYFGVVRATVPRDQLPSAPDGAVIDRRPWRPSRREAVVLAVGIGLCLPVAWVADLLDVAGAVLPGQLSGYAAAYALGALVTLRWERTHERRVLTTIEGGDGPALYALP